MDQGFIEASRVRGQRGFTIIELMIVVVVLAVLAVVVIPQFFTQASKVKSKSEVAAVFAEISIKEEQYKVDNGVYSNIAECPTTTTTAGVSMSTCMSDADWIAVRMNPAMEILRCKYQVWADGGVAPAGFVFTAPGTTSYYFAVATCDGDGDGANYATFFMSSINSQIQAQNEGS